jgi:hypothetical protein
MTVSSTTNRIDYNGDGNTMNFSFPFLIFDDDDLVIIFRNLTTQVEMIKAKTTDYTVAGVGDPDGGTVGFVSGHQPSSNEKVTILRTVVPTQEVALPLNNPFPSTSVELALDKLTALAQQLNEQILRSLLLPVSTSFSGLTMPDPEATKFLRWNDAGDGLQNGGTADEVENAQAYAVIAQNAANNLTCNRYEETVSGAAKSAFTLPFTIVPANANIAVIVNGVWQPPSAYTIVDTTHVTLSEAVPAGCNVNFISMNIPGLSSIQGKMDVPTSKVSGNLVQMDTNGNGVNAGITAIQALSGRKNIVINGDFNIWQRGTTATGIASGGSIIADRWRLSHQTDGVMRQDKLTTPLPTGKTGSALFINSSTADASLSASQFSALEYVIEGYDIQLLLGRVCTLSFWVYSDLAGTYHVSFANDSGSRSYVVPFVIDSSLTWEYKTVTFTMESAGANWKVDNSAGLRIRFCLGAGSAYLGTANSWQAANYLAVAGQANLMSSTTYWFALKQVQLELGAYATSFEFRPYAEELALCQRYYEKSYDQAVAPGTNTATGENIHQAATTVGNFYVTFPYTRKRATPATVGIYSRTGALNYVRDVTSSADVSVVSPSWSERCCSFAIANVVDQRIYSYHWSVDAEL